MIGMVETSQSTLQLDIGLELKDFKGLHDVPNGIPSAHSKETVFFPWFDGTNWICDGPRGPCDHFKRYGTECRHIKEMKTIALEEIYKRICEKVHFERDIRDADIPEFEEVVEYVTRYRSADVNKLATLLLNIAVIRGQVSTDDLHDATCEEYADNRIMGTVVAVLKREGFIRQVGTKKTERRIAHSRPIGVFEITKDGFTFLQSIHPRGFVD